MIKTARPGSTVWLLVSLLGMMGCSAIFDGHEYLSTDAAVGDSAVDARADSAPDSSPPDACAGACTGATAICEPTGGECVQCIVDHDCTGELVACSADHRCVACSASNRAACAGDTPVCDVANSACVQCNAHADCPASAPVCTDHMCGRCADATDCGDRTGTLACDSASGACVECVAASAAADCSTGVCTQGNTCSAHGRATQGQCEPCDAEDNCTAMHRCVPMTFGDPPVDHGSYCLKLASAGGCDPPYAVANMTTSLGGQAGPYCGIDQDRATCEAVRRLVDNTTCTDDTECGLGGLCRAVGVLSGFHCTYECVGPAQCDRSGLPGSTCGTGGGVGALSYCGG